MKKSEKRQNLVLNFMRDTIENKGFPPTIREICDALDVKSTSTIHSDINTLIKKGLVKKDPSKPRALSIVDNNPTKNFSDISVVEVPVIGSVAAGEPIFAESNIEDSMPIPARFIGSGNNFILRVKGKSMINIGINDGDYIVVEETVNANNGDIVVAMIDGEYDSEATVKRFFRENGHIRLQPENSHMDPIIVDDCSIVGKVRGVFRYFN